ncbi:unnamed protein product, partial [marine sediment metagenome]
RFNDWSLVKELYTPADAGSSTKTLKDRSRSGLVDHLQYYFVPYGSWFIAFRALNVKLTTIGGIAIFGTSGRYGRYPLSHQQPPDWTTPGAPFEWSGTFYDPIGDEENHNYYSCEAWGSLVIKYNTIFECALTHMPDPEKAPPLEGSNIWWLRGSEFNINWEDEKTYFKNEIVLVDIGGVVGSYMCMVDHLSDIDTNKPCDNDWETVWNAGDEFIKNVSISRQNMNISKGIEFPSAC